MVDILLRLMFEVHFVTTSDLKYASLVTSFTQLAPNIKVTRLNEDLPEIQARDNASVASFSAAWAAQHWQKPVIKEDVGLYLDAFNGFPGPFIKDVEIWLGVEGVQKLLAPQKVRSAYFEIAVSYCEPGLEPVTFTDTLFGKMINQAQGEGQGSVADKFFIPEGKQLTVAQLIDQGQFDRPSRHYQQLVTWLQQNKSV